MNKKISSLPISIYYSLIYMGVGAFTSYIGLYYAEINLDSTKIGLLTSAGAVIAIIAQPLWGTISDRAALKNRILSLILLFTGLFIWLMPLSSNIFWLFAASTVVFYFFQCAVNPLSDAVTLELSSRGSFKFSNIRTVGSLGYAIMAAIAGKLFDKNIHRIFPIFSIIMLSAFILSFSIPPVQGHQRGKSKLQLWSIFKKKELSFFYIYTFLIQSTMGFFYAFHAIYSKQQGISTQLIGIGVMIGSLSQFPFMLFFDKIYKRFGIKNILLLSGLVHAIRWMIYAAGLTAASFILLWIMHGFTYIVFYLCLAEYVNQNVVKELKASGQMMNSLMTQGISKVFGGLLGGLLASAIGIGHVFAIASALSIFSVLGFIIMNRTLFSGKGSNMSVENEM